MPGGRGGPTDPDDAPVDGHRRSTTMPPSSEIAAWRDLLAQHHACRPRGAAQVSTGGSSTRPVMASSRCSTHPPMPSRARSTIADEVGQLGSRDPRRRRPRRGRAGRQQGRRHHGADRLADDGRTPHPGRCSSPRPCATWPRFGHQVRGPRRPRAEGRSRRMACRRRGARGRARAHPRTMAPRGTRSTLSGGAACRGARQSGSAGHVSSWPPSSGSRSSWRRPACSLAKPWQSPALASVAENSVGIVDAGRNEVVGEITVGTGHRGSRSETVLPGLTTRAPTLSPRSTSNPS